MQGYMSSRVGWGVLVLHIQAEPLSEHLDRENKEDAPIVLCSIVVNLHRYPTELPLLHLPFQPGPQLLLFLLFFDYLIC